MYSSDTKPLCVAPVGETFLGRNDQGWATLSRFNEGGESAEALREKALRAEHPRSRERFMAL